MINVLANIAVAIFNCLQSVLKVCQQSKKHQRGNLRMLSEFQSSKTEKQKGRILARELEVEMVRGFVAAGCLEKTAILRLMQRHRPVTEIHHGNRLNFFRIRNPFEF